MAQGVGDELRDDQDQAVGSLGCDRMYETFAFPAYGIASGRSRPRGAAADRRGPALLTGRPPRKPRPDDDSPLYGWVDLMSEGVHPEVAGHGSGVRGVRGARAGRGRMTSAKIVGHRETSRFVSTSRALTRAVAHVGSVRTFEWFETDVLAGFVLARASARLTDGTIRGDVGYLEQVRTWLGRPLWDMEPTDADAYFGRVVRGSPSGTRLARSQALSTYFLFLELRHKVEIHRMTGRVVECLIDEMNRPRGSKGARLRIPRTAPEVGRLFTGWGGELATCREFAPTARNYIASKRRRLDERMVADLRGCCETGVPRRADRTAVDRGRPFLRAWEWARPAWSAACGSTRCAVSGRSGRPA